MNKSRIIELTQELASVPDTDTGYVKRYILEDIENELNEKLEDKNMRILKGYSKAEQKELENTKKNMSCNDLLHNITYFPANIECNPIKDKYDEADTDGRISIIRDILDFYTDKAKFAEQKYYVKLIRNDDDGYLNKDKLNTFVTLGNCRTSHYYQTEFTKQEIKAIDPRYLAFAVPVEADDE